MSGQFGTHGATDLGQSDTCCGEVDFICQQCDHQGMKVVSADGATTTLCCPNCKRKITIANIAQIKPGTEI